MNDIPEFVWRADFHCHMLSQYKPGFVIVDENTYRYGNLVELEMSLQNTDFMTITDLRFTQYKKVEQ